MLYFILIAIYMFINCFAVVNGSKDRYGRKESVIDRFIEPE